MQQASQRRRLDLRDNKGGVVVPFALAMIPVTVLTVGAVDMARGTMIRGRVQDALDAATLAVGRSSVTETAAAQTLGEKALAANLKLPTGTTLVAKTFTLDGSKVKGYARVKFKAIYGGMFTGGDMIMSAKSDVDRAVNKLEIALVLDTTGSMAGTKLSLLKTAANDFVDILAQKAAIAPEQNVVKIALVPFSMTVNVGSGYKTQTWIDQNGASPINNEIFTSAANRFTLFTKMGIAWAGCVESRQSPYDVQETAPTTSTPATLFTPYFAPDEPDTNSQSGGKNGNFGTFYNNYLTDKVYSTSNWKVPQGATSKYTTGVKTGTEPNTKYVYGPNAGCQLAPLVRLTTNYQTVKTGINAMTAVGDTNIPMGLVWGWHALTPNAPFADGAAYGTKKLTKIVVLMTDGQNQNTSNSNSNASYYSGTGYIWQNRLGITSGTDTQRRTKLDSKLTTLCTNMKAQGIVLYTVRVDVDDNNYAVLQNCASDTKKFYEVKDASELSSVFKKIAGQVSDLRLSK